MSRTSPTARAATVLSLAVLALAGCSDDGTPTPAPTQPSGTTASTPAPSTPSPTAPVPTTPAPTDTASASASPSPSGTTSVPAGFSLKTVSTKGFPSLGGDLGAIGGVRVGTHPGYDRVVWEFPGAGRPSLQVKYVDQPIADGSGDVVDIRGDAFLEVLVSSVGIPPANAPRPGSASAASLAGTVVAEAQPVYGGFEAVGQAFVGVRDGKRPFRVTLLRNPTRVVVDIWSG
ncbi:MAG: hypothetical protein ACJ72B_09970 [Ornithinibacter sp.]